MTYTLSIGEALTTDNIGSKCLSGEIRRDAGIGFCLTPS